MHEEITHNDLESKWMVLVQIYQQNSPQGSNWSVKKPKMDGQLLTRGWLGSKMVKLENRWHHLISYPRNPLDMNVQSFFLNKIILIKIIYHH